MFSIIIVRLTRCAARRMEWLGNATGGREAAGQGPENEKLSSRERMVSIQHHTWLRKWHSLADLATTREEKMHETRMMLSAKYKTMQYLKYKSCAVCIIVIVNFS